jgi:hypothetical protein
VRGAAPGELAAVWRACPPWPWLVVGATADLPPGLADLVDGLPIAVHWVGQPPAGIPGRPATHADWTALVAALERLDELTRHGVGGVRLLRNRGLQLPDGRIVLDAVSVEGLLAAPDGLALPPRGVEALQRELSGGALPLTLQRQGDLLRLA